MATFLSLRPELWDQGGMSLGMPILNAREGVSVWQGLGSVEAPCLGHCLG